MVTKTIKKNVYWNIIEILLMKYHNNDGIVAKKYYCNIIITLVYSICNE